MLNNFKRITLTFLLQYLNMMDLKKRKENGNKEMKNNDVRLSPY